jgi:hypothetical protein
MIHADYMDRDGSPSQGGQGRETGAGEALAALLYHSTMTDPLSLSAGIGARLYAAALLLAGLWAAVAWALAA